MTSRKWSKLATLYTLGDEKWEFCSCLDNKESADTGEGAYCIKLNDHLTWEFSCLMPDHCTAQHPALSYDFYLLDFILRYLPAKNLAGSLPLLAEQMGESSPLMIKVTIPRHMGASEKEDLLNQLRDGVFLERQAYEISSLKQKELLLFRKEPLSSVFKEEDLLFLFQSLKPKVSLSYFVAFLLNLTPESLAHFFLIQGLNSNIWSEEERYHIVSPEDFAMLRPLVELLLTGRPLELMSLKLVD